MAGSFTSPWYLHFSVLPSCTCPSPFLANQRIFLFYSQPQISSVSSVLSECTVSTPWRGLCYCAGLERHSVWCIRQGCARLQTLWPLSFLQPLLQRGVSCGCDPSRAGAAWQHLALGLLHDLYIMPHWACQSHWALICAQQ